MAQIAAARENVHILGCSVVKELTPPIQVVFQTDHPGRDDESVPNYSDRVGTDRPRIIDDGFDPGIPIPGLPKARPHTMRVEMLPSWTDIYPPQAHRSGNQNVGGGYSKRCGCHHADRDSE